MTSNFYKELLAPFLKSSHTFYQYFDESYSYKDAYSLMRKINQQLSRMGKGRGQSKVVLYGEKNFPVYCAIYSILLSNHVWIPMTPGLPLERMKSMLEVLKPDIFLYEGQLTEEVARAACHGGAKLLPLDEIITSKKGDDFSKIEFDDNDWAYVMFTSGSTGVPKGVPITHKNYINFINNAMEIFPFKKGEVFSDYHDFAFDISIFYLFCAPLAESALAPIRKKEERMFPLDHIQKNKITVWSSVPSVIACIQKLRPMGKLENDIEIMFLCGEPFSLNILKYCYENLNIKNVYNFYGLTETGVENYYHSCSPGDLEKYKDKGFVPIGKPLKGNEVSVTDGKELLLSGCQVTPGYLGGIEKTRFEIIDGKCWYHTGDIVEKYEDVYFCKGRMDSQVKISGHRIELMDIEVHIKQFPGVKEAVCFVSEPMVGAKRLVCALEAARSADDLIQSLGEWLKERLPEYMIPKILYSVESMPTNANGKIDRKAIRNNFSQKNTATIAANER